MLPLGNINIACNCVTAWIQTTMVIVYFPWHLSKVKFFFQNVLNNALILKMIFFSWRSSENPGKSEKPTFEKIDLCIETDLFCRAESKKYHSFFSPTNELCPGKRWKTGKLKRCQKKVMWVVKLKEMMSRLWISLHFLNSRSNNWNRDGMFLLVRLC
jgi:hypothetical protein